MGKYTTKGNTQLDTQIEIDIQTVVKALLKTGLSPYTQSILLLGGYGRGEGTPFIKNGKQYPFNDYDFIIVTQNIRTSKKKALQQQCDALSDVLSQKIGIHIDLYIYTLSELKTAPYTLLNYEMKYGHTVVYGQEIDTLMPNYALPIPAEEGAKLLLNRGKLLLDIDCYFQKTSKLPENKRLLFLKFLFKACLAMGDAYLIITNNYDISYIVKQKTLSELAINSQHAQTIKKWYLHAVSLKQWGDYSIYQETDIHQLFTAIKTVYLDFFFEYESLRLKNPITSLPTYYNALDQASDCPFKQRLKNIKLLKHLSHSHIHLRDKVQWLLLLTLHNKQLPNFIQRLFGKTVTAPYADAFYRLHRYVG